MADKSGKTSAGNTATDHIQTLNTKSAVSLSRFTSIMSARTPTICMIACLQQRKFWEAA
jgi:hypothetical protein